jgi:predicted nucleic acid-binding protein
MVLVDTSIWIRAMMGRPPYRAALDALLGKEAVLGHEFVYGELLVGDPGGRTLLLSAYQRWPFAPLVSHAEVVEFVRSRGLHGRGLGWVDVHLLASSLASGAKLYTADKNLMTSAARAGVLYAPS